MEKFGIFRHLGFCWFFTRVFAAIIIVNSVFEMFSSETSHIIGKTLRYKKHKKLLIYYTDKVLFLAFKFSIKVKED